MAKLIDLLKNKHFKKTTKKISRELFGLKHGGGTYPPPAISTTRQEELARGQIFWTLGQFRSRHTGLGFKKLGKQNRTPDWAFWNNMLIFFGERFTCLSSKKKRGRTMGKINNPLELTQ